MRDVKKDMAEKGLTAPYVTERMVSEKILKEQYFQFPGTTVTVCCITLTNGFTVIGQSSCASPENFDEGLGRQYANEDARRQIPRFEAYLLCESGTRPADEVA